MTQHDNNDAIHERAAQVSPQDVDELMEEIKNRVSEPVEGLSLLAVVAHALMIVADVRMMEYVDQEGRGIRLTCLPEAKDLTPPPLPPRGRQLH
ncbi:hypothetical protein V8420_001692 [Salmonella enterica subsp. enterica]|nr:hypothetical protein [Salmonella enterica]EBS1146850.1 hypothetical protein [Salmonella enterica subsp. enterica serovar Stanley]